MRRNQVVMFYGAPASGKYTMAKRLSEEHGFLLDNHYFHDMFKKLIEVPETQKRQYFDNVDILREDFLNIIKCFYPKQEFVRYIFTGCVTENEELLKFSSFATAINADFIPIELKADIEILKKRCQTEYRKWRKKISNPEKLERIINEYFCESPKFDHPNKKVINTSNMSEDETFKKIKAHLKRFE